jgi:tetratricopeptide (TPR) repeat protein
LRFFSVVIRAASVAAQWMRWPNARFIQGVNVQLTFVRRAATMSAVLSLVALLAACATGPRSATGADEPVTVAGHLVPERIAGNMAAAEEAQKAGKQDLALQALDSAAKKDPESKLPWLKRAQIHFEARQYGPAISAAQEVLQRDEADLTAKSILAVSGLRVSAEALEQLRKANEVNGSTRTEAESVARLIREALGEPILVDAPAAGVRPEARPASRANGSARSSAPRQTAQQVRPTAPAVVTPAKPATPAPTAAPATGSGTKAANPFGSLK